MRSNAWITVEKTRALRWKTFVDWYRQSERLTPKPNVSAYEEKAALALADAEHLFKAFLRPIIKSKTWIMLSVYDVTAAQLASGYDELGDGAAGGDFGVAGYWEWNAGAAMSRFVPLYEWRPSEIIQFMPPTLGPGDIEVPADAVRDVNLLFGQPPREFPSLGVAA